MAFVKLLHRSLEHRHANRAPGLLIARGVEQVGVALVLEQIHIRVVDSLTRLASRMGLKGLNSQVARSFDRARNETQPLCPGMAA